MISLVLMNSFGGLVFFRFFVKKFIIYLNYICSELLYKIKMVVLDYKCNGIVLYIVYILVFSKFIILEYF